jgi:hypothetical protein
MYGSIIYQSFIFFAMSSMHTATKINILLLSYTVGIKKD